jgi:hypothetical protein
MLRLVEVAGQSDGRNASHRSGTGARQNRQTLGGASAVFRGSSAMQGDAVGRGGLGHDTSPRVKDCWEMPSIAYA